MNAILKVVITLALALLISSCEDNNLDQQTFDKYRELWNEHKLQNYSYIIRRSCFCIPPNHLAMSFEDGEITSTQILDGNVGDEIYAEYFTIDYVFDLIQNTLDNEGEAHVEYDEQYGFPKVANLDPYLQAVDDEVYYSISNFRPEVAMEYPIPEPILDSQYPINPENSIAEANSVITTQEQLIGFFATYSQEAAPEIDFDQFIVVALEQGTKNTGGYDVQIGMINEFESSYDVLVKRILPKPSCSVVQAITAPAYAVALPKKDVNFVIRYSYPDC